MTTEKVQVEVVGGITTRAAVGGRELTLDPIRTIEVPLRIREVESTIPCGFQMDWGDVEVDGDVLRVAAGAGMGTSWATIAFRGKDYCFSIADIVSTFLEVLEKT